MNNKEIYKQALEDFKNNHKLTVKGLCYYFYKKFNLCIYFPGEFEQCLPELFKLKPKGLTTSWWFSPGDTKSRIKLLEKLIK